MFLRNLTAKYKIYNKRKALKSLMRKLKFKEHKKNKNFSEGGLSKVQKIKLRNTTNLNIKYKVVIAPSKLSFINNPVKVIEFIEQLKKHYDNKKNVFVVLQNVVEISYDAIVVLLSILVKFKANKLKVNGDFPTNKDARKIVEKSRFIRYLFKSFEEEERYELGQESSIHTHAFKDVDSILGSKLIENASITVWGLRRRCQGVQRTLLELMLNTNNHADHTTKGEKHWWISIHHDKTKKKVSFAFIDFGVGIFTSLNGKRFGSKFYGVLDKLKQNTMYNNNAELLKLIMDGTLHRTATGKSYHGKGLPAINKVSERNQISNLNIITNDVHANIQDDKFRVLPSSFSGTFIYWELNSKNINCHEAGIH